MAKKFCVLLTLSFVLLVSPSPVFADDVLFGTVERVERISNIIIVAPVDDRPLVAPEELVLIQSRIPGIDEAIESAKGYIDGTANNRIDVKITEGEPAIGDEVILRQGKYANEAMPVDENKWLRMAHDDIQNLSGANPPNVGAVCALAQLYDVGQEVEQNTYNALVLYSLAVEFNPSPNCAYEYGRLAFYGDMDDPPSFQRRPGEGLKWIRHAAERGHYFAMTSYADILELRREYRQAEKWLKKAIKIEPKVLSGTAKRQLERVRRKKR